MQRPLQPKRSWGSTRLEVEHLPADVPSVEKRPRQNHNQEAIDDITSIMRVSVFQSEGFESTPAMVVLMVVAKHRLSFLILGLTMLRRSDGSLQATNPRSWIIRHASACGAHVVEVSLLVEVIVLVAIVCTYSYDQPLFLKSSPLSFLTTPYTLGMSPLSPISSLTLSSRSCARPSILTLAPLLSARSLACLASLRARSM